MIEKRVTYGCGHATTYVLDTEPVAKAGSAEVPLDGLLAIPAFKR